MATPLTAIRNIGPAMAEALTSAAITSAEDLRALGPDAAYRQLVQSGHPPHFIAYYSLVMGLQGRPWNDCQGSEKANLRKRFDAIVSHGKDPAPAFARALDEVGVIVHANHFSKHDSDT